MATTYTTSAIMIAPANAKIMHYLMNNTGSGLVLKVYKIGVLNSTISVQTGVYTELQVRRLTAITAGTAIKPVRHGQFRSRFELPSQVISGTLGTSPSYDATYAPTNGIFMKVFVSPDESSAGPALATLEELNNLPDWNIIWNVGYNDSVLEPIVLRAGYGLCILCNTSTTVGDLSSFMVFTAE
jgi:hypothetical protein